MFWLRLVGLARLQLARATCSQVGAKMFAVSPKYPLQIFSAEMIPDWEKDLKLTTGGRAAAND